MFVITLRDSFGKLSYIDKFEDHSHGSISYKEQNDWLNINCVVIPLSFVFNPK